MTLTALVPDLYERWGGDDRDVRAVKQVVNTGVTLTRCNY
jgi:hypothetical protein